MLRTTLRANAIFSVITGAAAVIAASRLAPHLGLGGDAWLVAALGVGVIAFGGFGAAVASRPHLPRGAVAFITAADWAWVAASIAILALAWGELTATGRWVIALVAVPVAILAELELTGLRRMAAPGRVTSASA